MKRLLFISLLIFVVIGISCVSAAEGNSTDVMTTDSQDNLQIDEDAVDNVDASDDGQKLGDGEAKNFTTLNEEIESAAGGVLNLTSNYERSISEDSPYIDINKNLTINGNGFTIDAKKNGGIFNITGSNIYLKDIVFKNANAGAIIFGNVANATMDNCTFTNNSAQSGSAIKVYENSKNIEIINSTFINNKAISRGVIQMNGGSLTIYGSKFISNEANSKEVMVIESANVKITNTELNENSAPHDGAFYFVWCDILIDNCTFDGNHAQNNYPVLNAEVCRVNLNNTIFKRNSAKGSDVLSLSAGSPYDVLVNHCQFIDNDCTDLRLDANEAKVMNSQFSSSILEGKIAIETIKYTNLYLSNNTIADKGKIFSKGKITTEVTATILDNKTVNGHLNEPTLVYARFTDENNNNIVFERFNLLVNNSQISSTYNNSAQRYEGIFTANELGTYPVTISGVDLPNLTIKTGKLNIFDVNDFTSLQNLIRSSSALTLERDYIFNPNTDNDLIDGIVIDKDITIDGAGFTINANSQSRIFNIASGNVVLKNISFIDGNTTDDGGAINCNDGNLTVIGCNFSNNVAYEENQNGGAVFFNGESLTIDGSKFMSNKAYNGGAVVTESATAEIRNTEFSENSAEDYGALGVYDGNILIENCTFDSNCANESSAALYLSCDNVTISNTTFKANRAKDSGAIFYDSKPNTALIIDHCQFIDNDCLAVKLYSYHAKIQNSKFTNSTSKEGYAIYIGAICELYLSNNTINTNQPEIYAYGEISSPVTVTISDNKTVYTHVNETVPVNLTFRDDNNNLIHVPDFDLLVNNTKIDYVYNNSTQQYEANFTADKIGLYPISIENVDLSDLILKTAEINVIDDDFTSLQKLIDNANGTLTLTKGYTFNPNTDKDLVGGIVISKNITINGEGFKINGNSQAGIFNITSANTTINNITFINAKSTYVGAIYWKDCIDGHIANCGFANNYAECGGAICLNGINMTVSDCIFLNNSAEKGGAISFWTDDSVDISNCKFMDNSATEGGAIYSAYSTSLINIKNASFINNTADNNGGAISTKGTVFVANTNFTQNTAENDGGAIISEAHLTVDGCQFNNNSADVGGAINITEGLTVINSSFTANKAFYIAGAISAERNVIITGSSFESNTAGSTSGAVFVFDDLSIYNSTFKNNSAERGGAIAAANANIIKSNFTQNTACDGGAMYAVNNVTINSCIFDENAAENDGGAIDYNVETENSTLTIVDSSFNENIATNGGALSLSDANATVVNSKFDKNSATDGGAIYLDNTTATVESSEFTKNMAVYGGAIYSDEESQLNVKNSNFTANNAKSYGGAIYSHNNTSIDNCKFDENSADEGGALGLMGTSTISNSSFANNSASGGGAASLQNANITNSNFTDNRAGSAGALAIGGDSKISNSNFNNNFAEDGSNEIGTVGDAKVTLENVSPENLTILAHVDLNAGVNNVKYGNAVEIDVTVTKDLKNLNEGSVFVVINNKTYSSNVNNGSATIRIPNLDSGDYDGIQVTFNGSGKYTNSFDTVNFSVLKLNTTLTATAKTYVINYGGKYSVTLKDENGKALAGKTVTLTINGKEYKATSDANGVATFSLTKSILKSAGAKTATLKFAGDANYVGSDATAKITVKKEAVKILKAKKTYKFKKSKKTKNIKVTLKNSKNKAMKKVKVTLKLSGKKIKGKKTITAKTNKKGVVTFKLGKKLTKKTKVKYTITYKGNAYYLKATKKGKITVK